MTSRSITGLFLAAALLAAPAAAHAQSKSSGIWLGGLFGLEAGKDTGYQLRFDGEVPLARLSPTVSLAGVGTISYAGLSHNVKVFEFMPAARVNWAINPTFGAYGDIGLGLAVESEHSHTNTGATMRFLGGGYYEMNNYTRFVLELGLHPHFGNYNDTTFTLMIGAKFRI
jgi:hypothetical protein